MKELLFLKIFFYHLLQKVHNNGIDLFGYKVIPFNNIPIEYVYYSEADQILRFDSQETVDLALAVSNSTTYIIGQILFLLLLLLLLYLFTILCVLV